MPRNGSGTYTLPEASFTPGTTISSTAVNNNFSDVALALTGSLSIDGQSSMTGSIEGFAGNVTEPGYSFASDPDTGFFSVSDGVIGASSNGVLVGVINSSGFSSAGGVGLSFPIGMMVDYGGVAAPTGWLLCAGQAISRTTYAALFATIGIAYGSGNGVTTFNVPDLRGATGFGKDDMGGTAAGKITTAGSGIDGLTLGANGGAQSGILLQANLPSGVTGTIVGVASAANLDSGGNLINYIDPTSGTRPVTFSGFTGAVSLGGSGTAVNKMNPALIVNKIIYAGV
jgi:microcystin-dependent protein